MDGDSNGSHSTALLELVSNATRMDILRALAGTVSESPSDPWLSYAALRSEADVRDKGNFNYHLDRLDDLIVKEDDGYRISVLGMKLVSTVASRSLDPDWSWGPVDFPGDCAFCGESMHLRYEDGIVRLGCGTDEHELALPGTPSLLESHDAESVPQKVSTLLVQEVELVREGVCPVCEGHIDGEIRSDAVEPQHYHYHGNCNRCGLQYGFAVGLLVVRHPAVVSFLFERGTDLRETPFWTLSFPRARAETVVSTDPLRLRVDVERDGETLSLELDRSRSVVAAERSGDE